MLGLSSISETAVSSLSSFVFYIRGNGSITISISNGLDQGKLDIFGNSVNIIGITSTSVGRIVVARRRKIIIAEAVSNAMYSTSSSQSVQAESTQNIIDNQSSTKKFRVE